MSVEQAKAFIERMKTDEAFREKIMATETPEARLSVIKDAGFECTAEEINEAADIGIGTIAGGRPARCPHLGYDNGGRPRPFCG